MLKRVCVKFEEEFIFYFETSSFFFIFGARMNTNNNTATAASAPTASHLGNTPLNLAKLRELSRKELPEILDKVNP